MTTSVCGTLAPGWGGRRSGRGRPCRAPVPARASALSGGPEPRASDSINAMPRSSSSRSSGRAREAVHEEPMPAASGSSKRASRRSRSWTIRPITPPRGRRGEAGDRTSKCRRRPDGRIRRRTCRRARVVGRRSANSKRACGSMNRRISQADAIRSTPGRGRVTHRRREKRRVECAGAGRLGGPAPMSVEIRCTMPPVRRARRVEVGQGRQRAPARRRTRGRGGRSPLAAPSAWRAAQQPCRAPGERVDVGGARARKRPTISSWVKASSASAANTVAWPPARRSRPEPFRILPRAVPIGRHVGRLPDLDGPDPLQAAARCERARSRSGSAPDRGEPASGAAADGTVESAMQHLLHS